MVMEVVMLKMEAEEVTGMEDDRSDKNMGGNNKDNKKTEDITRCVLIRGMKMLLQARVQTSSKAKNTLELCWRQNLLPNNARSVKTTTSYNNSYNNNNNNNSSNDSYKIKHISTPKPESRGILLYCVNHNVGVFLPAER